MMKRFALLLLLAGTAVAQITDFEKCQQRACYGYGPPSGASQNGFIYQDLKENPAKLYCGQGGVWQLCASTGGSGNVVGQLNSIGSFSSATATKPTDGTVDSTGRFFQTPNINNVTQACNYPGSTLDAKIAAAETAWN